MSPPAVNNSNDSPLKNQLRPKEHNVASIKERFRKYDLNNDGFITLSELSMVMKAIDNFTDEELSDMFNEIDQGSDGKVSYNEFIDWIMEANDDQNENEELFRKALAEKDREIEELRSELSRVQEIISRQSAMQSEAEPKDDNDADYQSDFIGKASDAGDHSHSARMHQAKSRAQDALQEAFADTRSEADEAKAPEEQGPINSIDHVLEDLPAEDEELEKGKLIASGSLLDLLAEEETSKDSKAAARAALLHFANDLSQAERVDTNGTAMAAGNLDEGNAVASNDPDNFTECNPEPDEAEDSIALCKCRSALDILADEDAEPSAEDAESPGQDSEPQARDDESPAEVSEEKPVESPQEDAAKEDSALAHAAQDQSAGLTLPSSKPRTTSVAECDETEWASRCSSPKASTSPKAEAAFTSASPSSSASLRKRAKAGLVSAKRDGVLDRSIGDGRS